MQKLLKYIFVLVAVVALAACSSDDEPQTEAGSQPNLNGDVNYTFLTNLITDGEPKLFTKYAFWRYAKDETTNYEWAYNPEGWDGEVFGFPFEVAFYNGKTYRSGLPAELNSHPFLLMNRFFELYSHLHNFKLPETWIKIPFEFEIGERKLQFSINGMNSEVTIESTDNNSFTLSRRHVYEDFEDFGRFYVVKYALSSESRDFTDDLFFDSWYDFAYFIYNKGVEEYGPDFSFPRCDARTLLWILENEFQYLD